MFAKTEAGVYPDSRRYYYPLFASAYSSTYEGLLNYDNDKNDLEDNDVMVSESWTVEDGGVSNTYTRQDVIDATTGPGLSPTLNALVQAISEQGSPAPRTLDMFDQTFVQFVLDANSASPRVYEPCNTDSLPEDIAVICATLVENDMSDYALTLSPSQLEMCHSPEDEVVPIENVIQLGKLNTYLYETTGDHDTAGLNCIRRSVEFFNKAQFTEVRKAASSTPPTGVFCSAPDVPTTPSPSSSPTGSPSPAPTTRIPTTAPSLTIEPSQSCEVCSTSLTCCGGSTCRRFWFWQWCG